MYCDWPLLGRCCFCMPLRRGVLTFGYLNLLFSAFMVGVYSYSVHSEYGLIAIYHGANFDIPSEFCVAIYCIELIFNGILIYGAHKKIVLHLKLYYYFSLMTIVATLLLQIIDFISAVSSRMRLHMFFEIGPLMFASTCIQVYLIILVRSLIRKMDISSAPNVYDNPLQQFVYDGKTEPNGVYDTTVVPVDV
ncbi:unnamed protein product [Arctia plantaginis]|uniref:Uncharacterized protein n=1 Tax=Arctia plantaginis TaxID=874455 RepID=A0A8S0Z6H6_ARCPL|nr:unnamed protein product [Arctia plantaginis]CAB3228290.1 unnamed protein product [Arctia plantaginis]